jgi:SAM-dependent methyltransferase
VTPYPNFREDFPTISDFLDWWLRNRVLPPAHDAVFRAYYISYLNRFGAYARRHYADQTREIVGKLRASRAPRLLEVGGGCGTEALWFALTGARVLAIDVNEERLAVARARQTIVEEAVGGKLDLEFRLASLFALEESDAFDLVWMEQAFHHVEPREALYPTVSRLLREGGHVVISESNGWNPLLQLSLLRKRGFRTVVDRVTANGERIRYGNERITVPSALARGFSRFGVERQSVRYFRVLPNIAAAEALAPVEKAVPEFLVPAFTHYNYVGCKRSEG